MKVILLNSGGYTGMDEVNFPIVVEAKSDPLDEEIILVLGYELLKERAKGFFPDNYYSFLLDTQAFLIEKNYE